MTTNKQAVEHQAAHIRPKHSQERRLREQQAFVQNALENCYNDIRTAINAATQDNGNELIIMERIEHTLANALSVLIAQPDLFTKG